MRKWFLLRVAVGSELTVCAGLAALRRCPPFNECLEGGVVPFEIDRQQDETTRLTMSILFPGYVLVVADFNRMLEAAIQEIPSVSGFVRNAGFAGFVASLQGEGGIQHGTEPLAMNANEVHRLKETCHLFTVRFVDELDGND